MSKAGIKTNSFNLTKRLSKLKEDLESSNSGTPFKDIEKKQLEDLQRILDKITSGELAELLNFEEVITKTIEELIVNSNQKFFHHDISSKPEKVKEGCWIRRGNPTMPKMWTENYKPNLIICDEVQRLGEIQSTDSYDYFNEIQNIVQNSKKSFFTGDNFQMLNSRYDKGIDEIKKVISEKNENLSKYKLSESVGVPAEIGDLMKYLTNPSDKESEKVTNAWSEQRDFEIVVFKDSAKEFVQAFDGDNSRKKHFAAPMDSSWTRKGSKIVLANVRSTESSFKQTIESIWDHPTEKFAYKFPYFCNEEVMPNYILSAYELISREVESLYVHIPKIYVRDSWDDVWYKKHLYVLFTRPTLRLVLNFEDDSKYDGFKKLVKELMDKGAMLNIVFK